METIEKATVNGKVTGTCDPRFRGVMDAFLENFAERDELGASVCLTVEGRVVVDLWGGLKTVAGEPWDRDALCVVYSSTKGASATCAHMAVDRGLLDLDAPVTRYWPEFGQAGKAAALVSMMLDHSVGVPAVRDPLPKGSVYDYDYMCQRLAAETPFWEPGTRNGYHGLTSAWTVGEMVRRSTGRSAWAASSPRRSPARSASISGSACRRTTSRAWRRWWAIRRTTRRAIRGSRWPCGPTR